MGVRGKVLSLLVGGMIVGLSVVASAQTAQMSKGLEKFKAASQELIKLYYAAKDKAAAKGLQPKIDAATKRKEAAQAAIQAAMQKLDPKNPKHGKLAEKVFRKMQKIAESVGKAQLKAAKMQTEAVLRKETKKIKKMRKRKKEK